MTVVFVRHAATAATTARICCGGEWDLPLSALGRRQLDLTGRVVGTCGPIDVVRVSPLVRALETAWILFPHADDLEVDPDLAEWHLGAWSGNPIETSPIRFDGFCHPPGGESLDAFRARTRDALCRAAARAPRVAIVAHLGVWGTYARLAGAPVEIPNAGVRLLDRRYLTADRVQAAS